MADGDGAAIYIQLGVVQAKLSLTGQDLRSECFVDLETVDPFQPHTAVLKNGADCRDGTDAHDFWRHTNGRAGNDTSEGLFSVPVRNAAGRHQRGRSSIHHS